MDTRGEVWPLCETPHVNPVGKALDWLVSLVADKVLAGTWMRVTRRPRDEQRTRDAADERTKRLRDALGILAEGLAMNLSTEESRRKIAQALNELQTEGPASVDEDLANVVSAVESQIKRDWFMSQQVIHQLMQPIRAKVGPMLGKRG